MKNVFLGLSLFGLATVAFGYVDQPLPPSKIVSPIDKIFIPHGFDTNDMVEIVLKGTFQDGCHAVGDYPKVQVIEKTRTIFIEAYSLHYGGICTYALRPFTQVAKINPGALTAGTYKVIYKGKTNVVREFTVAEALTEGRDEVPYLQVETARLETKDNGKVKLVLHGRYPNKVIGCEIVEEIRVDFAPSDVMVVRPIAKDVDDARCEEQSKSRTFKVVTEVDGGFDSDGLLHVRTANGNSRNSYIEEVQ